MARLYPFRALRYDPTRVNLTDVVTQPYDKITPAMQDAYYAASPYNLIRVILGKHLPADTEAGPNVYTRAAATLSKWRAEGILKEESEPAIYGYSQTYKVPGSSAAAEESSDVRERRGVLVIGEAHGVHRPRPDAGLDDEVAVEEPRFLADITEVRGDDLESVRFEVDEVVLVR